MHDPAAAPYPGGDREVPQSGEKAHEDEPRTEPRPIGDRTGDQGHRDDRERRPIADGQQCEVRAGPPGGGDEPEVGEGVPRELRGVGDRAHRGSVEDPQHRDQADRAEAHHHHADDALCLDEPAVEERHAGSHQQHERRGRHRPGDVARLFHIVLAFIGSARMRAVERHIRCRPVWP
ncbi:hypothetical protein ABE10_01420 [Bacillus toyonensis]|nr:hypothetical protein [Bacillus toyonensis]